MKKLHKYLSIYATASATIASASVVYTDVDPDRELSSNNETFELDFNQDGNPEYSIAMQVDNLGGGGGWGPQVFAPKISAPNGNDIAGYYINGGGGWGSPLLPATFAVPYFEGSSISSNLNWEGNDALFGYYFEGNYGPESNGGWNNRENRYVALRFNLNGETHYGWVRCDVDYNYQKVTVKDYAYNDSPDEPIETGVTYDPELVADSVVATDGANKNNGLDLNVAFDKAIDESGIKEYRLFAVKSSASGNFGLGAANSSPYYKSVSPTGNRIETNFNEFSKDTDGEIIKEGIAYKVFVLTVPDFENLYHSNLSVPSNEVTLDGSVGLEEDLFNDVSYHIESNRLIVSSEKKINQIKLIELTGKTFFENQTSAKNFQIDLSNQAKGLILMQIEINGITQTKKIIL